MKKQSSNGAGTRAAATTKNQTLQPGNYRVEYQAAGINGSFPNTLLVDDRRRFALARRDCEDSSGRKFTGREVKPVSIPEALRWYAHVSDICDCGWGLPSSLFEAAASALSV